MPIPAATSSDVLLRTLLDEQAGDFEAWIPIEGLLARRYDNWRELPLPELRRSLDHDLEYLCRHHLLTLSKNHSETKLTPLGIFTALLFENASSE